MNDNDFILDELRKISAELREVKNAILNPPLFRVGDRVDLIRRDNDESPGYIVAIVEETATVAWSNGYGRGNCPLDSLERV